MATRKKSRKKSGSSWLGLVLGMVLGVAAAVAVALIVIKAPMPFQDKASRSTASINLPPVGDAPDPNIALYGANGAAGTRSLPQGGAGLPSAAQPDGIGQLLAQLEQTPEGAKLAPPPPPPPPAAPQPPQATSAQAGAAAPPQAAAPAASAKAPAPPAPPAANKAPQAGTQTVYYLQTGAFRSEQEANNMMARIIMLGLQVRVETGQANGGPINRVRVGPFKGIDEMNRARGLLGGEKIESTVIRP